MKKLDDEQIAYVETLVSFSGLRDDAQTELNYRQRNVDEIKEALGITSKKRKR